MTETEQREKEIVAGILQGVTQKKPDTWQVEVKPENSQYTKKLWTKDAALVSALSAKLGEAVGFVCGASYWTNQSGTEVRSLWVDSISDGTENLPERVATPGAAQKAALALDTPAANLGGLPSSQGMSKDEWGQKDSAIHRMAATKAAADALKHTVPADPTPEDLHKFIDRVKTVSYQWWLQADAVRRGDDSDIPFLSEHDQAIGYPE